MNTARLTRSTTPASRPALRGVTLIESLITLAVTAVTLGTAIPNFSAAADLRRLEGASAQLATDLQHARGLAVARRANVRVDIQSSAAGSCYVIHTGGAGGCQCSATSSPVCSGNAQPLRVETFPGTSALRLSANSASMLFDADRGTVTPTGTLQIQLRSGPAIRHVVNIMGRARRCSPAPGLPGYATC
jgi:type IV fimbrial biogenesis protein FimT